MAINRIGQSAAPGHTAFVDGPDRRIHEGDREKPRTRLVTDVLVISDDSSVASYVTSLFRRSGWAIDSRSTCGEGVSFINETRAAVAICAETLPDGSWQDVALAFSAIPHAPALIVLSDGADSANDVVALGGFDALVRPLCAEDVVWSVASAWREWWKRHDARDGGVVACSDA
jgi:DNA-binding NtrC family response regulator